MKKLITIVFALILLQSCTVIHIENSRNVKINIDGKNAEKKARVDDVRASFYNVSPTQAVSYEKMMEEEKKKEND